MTKTKKTSLCWYTFSTPDVILYLDFANDKRREDKLFKYRLWLLLGPSLVGTTSPLMTLVFAGHKPVPLCEGEVRCAVSVCILEHRKHIISLVLQMNLLVLNQNCKPYKIVKGEWDFLVHGHALSWSKDSHGRRRLPLVDFMQNAEYYVVGWSVVLTLCTQVPVHVSLCRYCCSCARPGVETLKVRMRSLSRGATLRMLLWALSGISDSCRKEDNNSLFWLSVTKLRKKFCSDKVQAGSKPLVSHVYPQRWHPCGVR